MWKERGIKYLYIILIKGLSLTSPDNTIKVRGNTSALTIKSRFHFYYETGS